MARSSKYFRFRSGTPAGLDGRKQLFPASALWWAWGIAVLVSFGVVHASTQTSIQKFPSLDSDDAFLFNPFRSETILFGDDFESEGWRSFRTMGSTAGSREALAGPVWMSSQMQEKPAKTGISGRLVGYPHPVRAGEKSMRVEWHRDHYERGVNVQKKAMLHGPKLPDPQGGVRWYAFSLFIPSGGNAPDAYPNLVFQVHATPDRSLGEPWRKPYLALSYGLSQPPQLELSYRWDEEKVSPKNEAIDARETVISLGAVQGYLDRWVDFVLFVRTEWAAPEGTVILWVDGVKKVHARAVRIGYNDAVGGYPSIGVYRPGGRSEEKRNWLYFDSFRIGGAEATYEAMTAFLPAKPERLDRPRPFRAQAEPAGGVRLTWEDSPPGIEGFLVDRRTSSGRIAYPLDAMPSDSGWEQIAEIPGDSRTYLDSNPPSDQVVHYRLRPLPDGVARAVSAQIKTGASN